MQLALVDYLSTRRYDAHLRRLRRQLAERKQQAWQTLFAPSPGGSKKFTITIAVIFFGWSYLSSLMPVNLAPKRLNTLSVSRRGKMFSTSGAWTRFFRFNTAWHWGEREEQAVKQLGSLIREMLSAKSLV